DFELVGPRGGFDEALYGRVATTAGVAVASPIVDAETFAFDGAGRRFPIRVLGVDAFVVARLAPALMPRPRPGADRFTAIDPGVVFVNVAAEQRLGSEATSLALQTASGRVALRVAGSVAAGGPPLAVMDIAGAQVALGLLGRLQRIEVRLVPGVEQDAVVRALQLPAGVRAAAPAEATERVSNVSRAYRVNLTVLALVAMFTGAFLVFSILALSVAQRLQALALLAVLGLGARQRLALVLAESALLGVAGSVLGLALGTGLAAAALELFGGDLGGGYFAGVAPALRFDAVGATAYGLLGVVAALVGGWLPARAAERIAPAQALKGLGVATTLRAPWRLGLVLIALGAALATLPPLFGIPLAAYLSVALLLIGGIACVPGGVGIALSRVAEPRHALALLAVERARHQRSTATIAVAGVVASLALSVALTVMVASFRDGVTRWLDVVLPADLYVRAAVGTGSGDLATLPAQLVEGAAAIPGVTGAEAQRVVVVQLDPRRPAAALLARPVGDPERRLPIAGSIVAAPAGAIAVYVSEAIVALYGAAPATTLALPLPDGRRAEVFVRAVWRDYARQYGAIVIDREDWRRLTGDERVNDLALRLAPGTGVATVEEALRRLAAASGYDPALLEFSAPGEIRAASLRIFDRSFAVTYWLQAVAIAIGLFGIAASFSAQVLARRKEFGLLVHLGLTRRQILAVVAAEGAVWTGVGAALGLVLGIAVSVILVKVVNPQSFHWTMDLLLPGGRLALLGAAVVVAGTLTAWLSARRAVGRQTVLAVKEDW
ncbi:MAG: FtsX-like permease family protein, partial [Caldimonas sp.]